VWRVPVLFPFHSFIFLYNLAILPTKISHLSRFLPSFFGVIPMLANCVPFWPSTLICVLAIFASNLADIPHQTRHIPFPLQSLFNSFIYSAKNAIIQKRMFLLFLNCAHSPAAFIIILLFIVLPRACESACKYQCQKINI
jgi:hypothetical protein